MSCHNCCSEFGVFKKEYGCESCGFAFCGKCCNKKTVVNEGGKSKQLLCNGCFTKLSGGKTEGISHSSIPPSALEKRLAFGKHSFSLDTQPKASAVDSVNEKDKEIAERLQKLKRERNKELLPSQGEIEERLAKLKGMDPAKYTAPPIMVYRPADKRSAHEQTVDLIKEVEDEVKIESSIVKPEDEIAGRLARLRGVDSTPRKSPEDTIVKSLCQEEGNAKPQEEIDVDEASALFQKDSEELEKLAQQGINELNQNEEYKALMERIRKREEKKEEKADVSDEEADEEEEANRLLEQLLSSNIENEVEDPESLNGTSSQTEAGMSIDKSEESDEYAPEEFPWCVICTEDARLKCFGCSGDLYCMRCFRECHDSLDIKDHKTCPFLSSKV